MGWRELYISSLYQFYLYYLYLFISLISISILSISRQKARDLAIVWLMIVHLITMQKCQVFSRNCALKFDTTLACDTQDHALSLCWAEAVSGSSSQPCAQQGNRRAATSACVAMRWCSGRKLESMQFWLIIFFFLFGVFETWPHSVAQADLQPVILLPLPSRSWDYSLYHQTWLTYNTLTYNRLVGVERNDDWGTCKHVGICYIYNKIISYGAREVVQPIRAITALAEGSVSSTYTTNYICLLLSFQGIWHPYLPL